jgi:hypothetical protein
VKANNGGHWSSYSNVWHFSTAGSVGVQSYAAVNEITISPNPSTGQFLFSNMKKEYQIEIYDINGKMIYQGLSENPTLLVDLSGKDKGIYFYKISESGKEIREGKLLLE